MLGPVCAWQVVCICWSWWLLFFAVWRNSVCFIGVNSKIVGRFRIRKSSSWGSGWISYGKFGHTNVDFFFHGHTILYNVYHTDITGNTVTASHPPNQGHSKRYTTSISIHPLTEFVWTRSTAHVWYNDLFWSSTLPPKYTHVLTYSGFANFAVLPLTPMWI